MEEKIRPCEIDIYKKNGTEYCSHYSPHDVLCMVVISTNRSWRFINLQGHQQRRAHAKLHTHTLTQWNNASFK